MNVTDYLFDNPAECPDVALLTPSSTHSYAELVQACEAVASFLIRSGLRKGDRVLLVSDNSFFWIACYLGSLRAGCVSTPLPPNASAGDLAYVALACDIRCAFIHARISHDHFRALPTGCLRVIESETSLLDDVEQPYSTFPEVLTTASATSWPDIDEGRDLAAIMFTSGSTSKPRGVMISHRNIIANTSSIVEYMELTRHDRIMTVLPFFYCFGTSLLHSHLRAGASLVIDPRFMFPDKVLTHMQETNCTGFAGVPSHYQLLLRKSSLRQMQFPDLRYLQQAGGKLSDSMIRDLQSAVPSANIFIMYGQTEATARLSYLPPAFLYDKLGSIGKGIPGVTLTVIDESGIAVRPGQVGEIVAAGDNIALGYWGVDGSDNSAFRGSSLYTGDLATVDEDGFIFIVDRSKDILKCGGKRSSCKEVEAILLEFEDVVEAAVIGVPDDLQGEAVKAFVVAKVDGGDLVQNLREFCMRRLPAPLVPKEIIVLEALPKNSAGKVLKPALRSLTGTEIVCQ
jgi:long-chain acyl-CoA synthetase